MVQQIFSTAALALAFVGEVSAINAYSLIDDYKGAEFFQMFEFYTGADPTWGTVEYVSGNVAANASSDIGIALISTNDQGQNYMGVDYVNVVTEGRPSVRIESKKSYTQALIIADFAHMPASVCGTWPAFWTLNSTNYPAHGEIDILENVHENTVSLQTLHSGDGCQIVGNMYSTEVTDNITTYNCNDAATSSNFGAQDGNSACSGTNTDPNSYGSTFNAVGGGVYVMQWTSDVIRMWNFAPDAIPADITAGTPNPDSWKTPAFTTAGGVCNIEELFENHQIVIDTTFCGEYAGKDVFWEATTCYDPVTYPVCEDYVRANPAVYKEAYWLINSIKVYQNATAPVATTAIATSTKASIIPTSAIASVVSAATSVASEIVSAVTSEIASVASTISAEASVASTSSPVYLLSGETSTEEVAGAATTTIQSAFTNTKLASTIYSTVTVSGEGSTSTVIPSVSAAQIISSTTIIASTPDASLGLVASLTVVPVAGSSISSAAVLETSLVVPVPATITASSESVYDWLTVTTEGTSTIADSNPASIETNIVVPVAATLTASTEAVYDWKTVVTEGTSTIVDSNPASSVVAVVASASSVSGEASTAILVPIAASSVASEVSGESTAVSEIAQTSSSLVYLVSDETNTAAIAPSVTPTSSPISAVALSSSSVAISAASVTPSIIYSTATLIPQAAPATTLATSAASQATSYSGAAASLEGISARPSNMSLPTGIVIATSSGILATAGSTETFTFAMPAAYSASGTSDTSGANATAYPIVITDSGVGRLGVKGGVFGAMAAVLVAFLM